MFFSDEFSSLEFSRIRCVLLNDNLQHFIKTKRVNFLYIMTWVISETFLKDSPDGHHRKHSECAGQYEDKPRKGVQCALIDLSIDGCGDQACNFERQLEHDKGKAYRRKSRHILCRFSCSPQDRALSKKPQNTFYILLGAVYRTGIILNRD